MKNLAAVFAVIIGLLAAAQAQEPAKKPEQPAAQAGQKAPELKEKTGVIEVIKADAAKKEKYDTVLLKAGEEKIKLLPGKDKKLFKPLEGMTGKTVTVKGQFLPPNPPKYPLAALKVEGFSEAKAEKAAKQEKK